MPRVNRATRLRVLYYSLKLASFALQSTVAWFVIHSLLTDQSSTHLRRWLLGVSKYESLYESTEYYVWSAKQQLNSVVPSWLSGAAKDVTPDGITQYLPFTSSRHHTTTLHQVQCLRSLLQIIHLGTTLLLPWVVGSQHSLPKSYFYVALLAPTVSTVLEYSVTALSIAKLVLPSYISVVVRQVQNLYLLLGSPLIVTLLLLWWFNKSVSRLYPAPTKGQNATQYSWQIYWSLCILVPHIVFHSISNHAISLLLTQSPIVSNILVFVMGVGTAIAPHTVFLPLVTERVKTLRRAFDYRTTVPVRVQRMDDATYVMQIPLTFFEGDEPVPDLNKYTSTSIPRSEAEDLFYSLRLPPRRQKFTERAYNTMKQTAARQRCLRPRVNGRAVTESQAVISTQSPTTAAGDAEHLVAATSASDSSSEPLVTKLQP